MPHISEILGAKNLVGVIQGSKHGVKYDAMPAGFMTPNRSVIGNYCTYNKVEGNQQLARLAQYGSPSKLRGQKGLSQVPVTLLHAIEHIVHEPVVLQWLMNLDNEQLQSMGMQEISRQTVNFKYYFENLRVAAVLCALFRGYIYFDSDGNLQLTSTNAVTTIDYQVPTSNKDQFLDMDGNSIIDVSWAGSPDIQNQMDILHKTAIQRTGYQLTTAFYGTSIFEYVRTYLNTVGLLSGNPVYQQSLANRQIPNGLFGFNWIPAGPAFFADKDGDVQSIANADTCVFTPDPSPDWYEMIEGSYVIPNNLGNVTGDGVSALSNLSTVNGMFSYASVLSDPVSIKHVSGDTFLPVIKVPGALFIGDMVF